MARQYPVKVLVAWGEAISGNAEFRDWLLGNGYPELGLFVHALHNQDEARAWLLNEGFPELMALCNGAEGKGSAVQWLRNHDHPVLALMALAAGAEPALERFAATALSQLLPPALVYLDLPTGPHFSVVTEVAGDRVALADPSAGFVVWSKAQFLAAWAPSGAGYVLTVTADPGASM